MAASMPKEASSSRYDSVRPSSKLRRRVQSGKGYYHAPGDRPDLHEQAAALAAHVWQNGPVDAQHPEDVGIELIPGLAQGERFERAPVRHAGVVDHDIETSRHSHDRLDRLIH